MSGYTRQSTATIVAGAIVRATPLNNEFDALQTAFGSVTGHTHDGSVGNAPPIDLTTSVSEILPVANGGTGLSSLATFVTLTGTETLTNKTITRPTITLQDSITTFQDNSDNTKQFVFEASGITTATTRTYTVPNYDATFATLAGTETLTNKTLTSPTITGGSITGITDLAVADGGTGASDASGARTNLGLVIGTNVQAWDADLDTWATKTAPSGTVVGTTDSQSLSNKTLTVPTITGYTETMYSANTSTAITIDLANGTVQDLTLTGNCTFTFPSNTAGKSFLMILRQDGTGSRTATWDSDVKWPSNTAPTITATASKADLLAFTCDGTYWYGRVIGQLYL